MNQNPIIKALQDELAKERDDLRKGIVLRLLTNQYGLEKTQKWLEYGNYKLFNDDKIDFEFAFDTAHEAATERLLAIVEMYEDTLTAIDWHIRQMQNEKLISIKEMCRALKVISDKYRPEQFLTTLADASGEIKKDGK